MTTSSSLGRLHDALRAVAAAATAGDPVIALSALDSLDAESEALRGMLTADLNAAGQETLDGACGPPSDSAGHIKAASPAMGRYRVTGTGRTGAGGYH